MTTALPIKLHNSLAQAKYVMNASEEKLFVYAIRDLDQSSRNFIESKFSMSDFAEYADLDIKRLYKDIDNMIENIMKTLIHVRDKNNPNKWIKYNLTQKCIYNKGEITFRFSNDMKHLLLQLQQHFFYQSPEVVKFKSWYSIRLYNLLKSESYKNKTIEMSLDHIKIILGLEDKYDKFSNFKARVVDVAFDEINSTKMSDIRFTYEVKYKGRSVSGILFTVVRQDQEYIEYIDEVYHIEQIKEAAGLNNESFNSAQILEFYEKTVVSFPHHRNAEDLFLYMNLNYTYTKDRKQTGNPYGYYKKALENDYAKAVPQIMIGSFV